MGTIRLPQSVDLDLPEAGRGEYAGLAALWRSLQDAMLENAKGHILSADGDAVLFDPVAEYLSTVVIPQLAEQADGRNDTLIRPRLRVDGEIMIAAVSDLAWHDQWLGRPEMLGALGVDAPGLEVLRLRERVIRSIVEQLAPVAGWPLDASPGAVPTA